MTDRLSLTNALADANIDRQKAERIATEIFDAIHDNVATKADVDRLGACIDQVESGLRAEMRELELRLERRIDRTVVRLGSFDRNPQRGHPGGYPIPAAQLSGRSLNQHQPKAYASSAASETRRGRQSL